MDEQTKGEVVKGEGTHLLSEEQWKTLEANKVNRSGLDDVLIYGWTDLTTNQKIAIGQMQETIHSLELRIRSFERYEKKQEGKVEALERVVDILIDRMLKAVDLTGRL